MDAVAAARLHLDELYERGEPRAGVVASLHQRINLGVKLAEVQALLDIADAIRDLSGAPPVGYTDCDFDRCVTAP